MSVDTIGARELELFIENDSQLYRQQYQPIQKNLRTKQARGIYQHDKAVKAFKNLVDNGARRYGKEFSGSSQAGLRQFSPSTRRVVAKSLTNHFEIESKLGNYDYLLPKKYREMPKGVASMERTK
ncbi:MAG: hypothetical protein E6L04_07375 [Thaumarchaeota archaeon]|nr:MAG: hypothetical protein E6L04_07375 [Nitrososphaerota archaeon]